MATYPDDAADADRAFVKRRGDAPEGFFAAEAAGLAWLAQAEPAGGARIVRVLDVGRRHITLQRLHPASASTAAAEDFGRGLAATHRSGAPSFGCAAPGSGAAGWIGPLPLPVHDDAADGQADALAEGQADPPPGWPRRWGPFFAVHRLEPYLHLARDRSAVDAAGARVVRRVCERLAADDPQLTGPSEPVARLHGDLWSGNVIWTPSGAVLIDPAAHGGHRESDLAMLALFGAPYLERILAAYHEADPLADGWRERVGLHQLFPLLVHAALFGSGYGAEAVAVARRYG